MKVALYNAFEEVLSVITPVTDADDPPCIREGRESDWLCLHLTHEAFVEGTVFRDSQDRHIHVGLRGDFGNWTPWKAQMMLKPYLADVIHRALFRYRLEGGG